MIKKHTQLAVIIIGLLYSVTLHSQCPVVSFNNIAQGSPYDCSEKIALQADSVDGFNNPGFSFIINLDEHSMDENVLYFYVNNVLADSAVPKNNFGGMFTVYAQYLNPALNYSLRWCDKSMDGVFPWELYDHAGERLLKSGNFDHGASHQKCFNVTIPKLKGIAKFTGVGVTDFSNGRGEFNPAVSGPGIFDITYYWNDELGCQNSSTQTIRVIGPSADAGTDKLICSGDTVILGGNPTAYGGAPTYRYNWSSSKTLNNPLMSNPIGKPESTTIYYLTVTDNSGKGCKAYDTVVVNMKNSLFVGTTPDTSFCKGNTAILKAFGGLDYLWNTGEQTSSINITPLVSQAYTVSITDSNSCKTVKKILVSFSDTPKSVTSDTSVCEEEIVLLKATGGGKYLWSTTDTTSEINHKAVDNEFFTVTITDINNCTGVETVALTVNSKPLASFEYNRDASGKINFVNTSSGNSSSYWDFGDGNTSTETSPSHLYNDGQDMHNVMLVVQNAAPSFCSDTIIMEIDNSQKSRIIKIADVFIPTGSKNNTFAMEAEGIRNVDLSVFNRWGEKVYSTKLTVAEGMDKKISLWDGKNGNGNKMEEGTYFYIIKAIGFDSKEFNEAGSVTLIQ